MKEQGMKSRILKMMGVAVALSSIAVLTLSGAPVSAKTVSLDVHWVSVGVNLKVNDVVPVNQSNTSGFYGMIVPRGESDFDDRYVVRAFNFTNLSLGSTDKDKSYYITTADYTYQSSTNTPIAGPFTGYFYVTLNETTKEAIGWSGPTDVARFMISCDIVYESSTVFSGTWKFLQGSYEFAHCTGGGTMTSGPITFDGTLIFHQ